MDYFITIFFHSVVVLFTVASTIYAGYSVQNKMRLRNIRLSWRVGTLKGFPIFATIFIVFIVALFAFGSLVEEFTIYGIIIAYVWISGMFFISSYLASKYYLTDYGIVKNINEPSQTIPWFQILDYVEKKNEKGVFYTFTYSEMDKSLTKGYNQLRLFVPKAKNEAVKKIITLKLQKRFEGQPIPDIDLKRIQKD